MRKIILSLLGISLAIAVSAQCSMIPVPLTTRAHASNLIVEGKVISKNSFWNSNNTMIYTSNFIEVYKIFKGQITTGQIEILTEGGIVNDRMITANPSLELNVGEIGVFTCEPVTHAKNVPVSRTGIPRFEAYASMQGFLKYNLETQTAVDPFSVYNNIESEIYNVVLDPSLRNYRTVKQFDIHSFGNTNRNANPNSQSGPSISGFSPTTVTSGTNTQITITGLGFGASPGSVGFANADDGGASFITALPTQIISWSATSITVEVPTKAGTGQIQVTQGTTATSAATLTVSWAHLNVSFNPGTGTQAYQTDHISDNGSGGYTWQMNTAFDANASERASFMRAFDTWRCTTGINWVIGANTSVNDHISDGVNCICDDAVNPLSAGILGVCFSYYQGCNPGSGFVWHVSELDIIFDDGSNLTSLGCTWQYGPTAPTLSQYDFESVAVHELGHGHQLGHVIFSGQIMHYALSNGASERVLSANDIAAGNFVQAKSLIANACGDPPMTNHSCGTPPVADFSGSPTTLCAGGTVNFTDLSTNNPTSWSWVFQGGTPSTSTSQNPSIIYNTAGTYSVTLTATNGSGSDGQSYLAYITVNANPSATGVVTNISCNGGSNGAINLTPSGGTGPYTFFWNPSGQTTEDRAGLVAATYSVTVTDANSCVSLTSYAVTQPSAITASTSQTNVSCNGGGNGSATVTPSGGTPSYTYAWTPSGGTAATSDPLFAGNYTCTITDANGCQLTKTFNITQPAPLAAGKVTVNVTCFGGSDGSGTVTPSGGTAPYTFNWTPLGGTAATASNLVAGSYVCTITDANGCSLPKNFLITQPTPISSTPSQVDETCNGGSNGSATVVAGGGTPGYSYSWSPSGGTAATASSLTAGNYTCTITDANSCTLAQTFTITEPGAISVSMSMTDENCSNADGTATATPSGGNSPYTYAWAIIGQTTQMATNLPSTTYTCTVTDQNGCTGNNSILVGNTCAGSPPVANFSGTPTSVCVGGSVDFTDLSSNTPTSWTWTFQGGTPSSSNAQNPTVVYNTAGTYSVSLTATNSNGSDVHSVVGYITVNSLPSASGVVTNVSCNGGNNGAIDLTPSGGTGPYSFLWNPSGQTIEDIASLSAATYSVTVTDANGCTSLTSYAVTQPTAIGVGMSRTQPTCANNDGTATATASGGVGPYTYLWSPGGQTTATATALAGGTYTCSVTDANGCANFGTITLTAAICGSTQLDPASCGITLTSLNQTIHCVAVPGASNYGYRWICAAQGYNQTFFRGAGQTNFVVNWVTGIQYGRTYTVEVRVLVGTTWSNWGPVCTVTTPATIPTTQVSAPNCGATLAALSTQIFCNAVPGASNYQWHVVNASLGYDNLRFRGNGSNDWRLSWNTGTMLNKTYTVTVRAYVGGVWGAYGPACSVTTGPVAMAPHDNSGVPSEVRLANPDAVYPNDELEMTVYPNPFASDITVTTSPDVDKVSIYNSFGELVRVIEIENGTAELSLGDLPNGIYLIEAQTTNGTVTRRIIKQD